MSINTVRYDSVMCDRVIMLLKTGKSIDDVLTAFSIDHKTLEEWRQKFPEFDEAIEKGLTFCQAYWEQQMRLNLTNPHFDTDYAIAFMVKNFDWK